jgi:hypothetical protein
LGFNPAASLPTIVTSHKSMRGFAKGLMIGGLEFMKRIAPLLVVLFLTNALASAQVKKFRWEDEICVFEGTYNARLYTEKQLENTYKLWYSQDFEMVTYDAAVFSFEDIEKLRTARSLDAEYARKSAALKKLEVVDVPFWKAFKQKKQKALEQDYKLARASVQAYQNPKALREVRFAAACVQKFAPALIAGGDDLLRIWREVNVGLRKKNGNPEEVRKNFEAQMASADKFKFAEVEVITFGWWNCVNALIERGDESPNPSKNFRKLFKHVNQIGCDNA